MSKQTVFQDLGMIRYEQAQDLQLKAVQDVLAGGPERIFLLEHYPVITLGRNHCTKNLLGDSAELEARGVEVVQSTRGGDITCHFPGQLVVYPVMRLKNRPGGLKDFFVFLELVIISLLKRYSITGQTIEGRPGVFVEGRKICSMGTAVRRWISYHGLALNLGRDIDLFKYINPCGYTDMRMTSIHLETKGSEPDMEQLKKDFQDDFSLARERLDK